MPQYLLSFLLGLITLPMAFLQSFPPTEPPLSSIFILIIAFFVSLASTLVSRKMIDIDKLRRLTRETKAYQKLRMQMIRTADSKLKLKYERNADRMRKVQSELTMMNMRPLLIMFIPMIIFFVVLSGFYSVRVGTSYIAYSEATDGDSVSTMVINKPSGTIEDDLMIALLVSAINSDNNGTTVSSAPTGWINEHNYTQNAATGQHVYIYWKIAGDSEPSSYSWTWTDNCSWIGQINTFRNVNITDPIDVVGPVLQKTEQHAISPNITTTEDNCMIWLYAMANDDEAQDGHNPSGTKKIEETERSDPGSGIAIETAYFKKGTAGTTETKKWEDWLNDQDTENSAQQVALRPAYGGKLITGNIPGIIPFALPEALLLPIGDNGYVAGWGYVFVPRYIWWYFGGSLAFGSILRKTMGLQPD